MEQIYQNILIHTVAFPPIQWVAAFYNVETIYIEAQESYQKKSLRNKYQLGSQQGIQTLSVPLEKGKNHQKPILDVRISYQEDWQCKHLKFFQSVYGRSPFYEFYKDDLLTLFSEREYSLFHFNLKALELIKAWLSIPADFRFTQSYQKTVNSATLDMRNLKTTPLANTGFAYDQIFGIDFIPDLSILDLVFHLGPETPGFLNRYKLLM